PATGSRLPLLCEVYMDQPQRSVGDLLYSRREFVGTTAAALAAASLPGAVALSLAQADNQKPDESADIPMIQKPSPDADLSGKWHILDRSRPIRKLIDRKSLLPVGPRSLVMIDIHLVVSFPVKSGRHYLIAALPADVGDEQALLGCHVSVKPDKGKE